jgi:putative hydrolase of the HAD superfamily
MSVRNKSQTVWFFDLDNTLHDASHASFGPTSAAMTDYMVAHLQVDADEAAVLRNHYWHRYGATLLGLVRHHGVHGQHFLEETHRLPGLEARLRTSAHDRAALQRLPGRKVLLTNAPRHYALRVMRTLNLLGCFDVVLCVEDMRMFGHWRPKPDVRMFRHVCARLKVRPAQCVLVEDTLEHQQAAHSLGMRTVWMQRYLRSAAQAAPARPGAPRRCIKPPYVCARIHRVLTLLAPW